MLNASELKRFEQVQCLPNLVFLPLAKHFYFSLSGSIGGVDKKNSEPN